MKIKYSFRILLCTLLMTIGYATVNSITYDFQGIAVAQSNDKIFITNTEYKSDQNANIEDSKFNMYMTHYQIVIYLYQKQIIIHL